MGSIEGKPQVEKGEDGKWPANEALADFVVREQRRNEDKNLRDAGEQRRMEQASLKPIESEVREPRIGEEVCIPGADSHTGGLTRISETERGISGGREVWKVRVEAYPRTLYTWEDLFLNQAYYKEHFGNQQATITDPHAV